jgi:hypothetical protein
MLSALSCQSDWAANAHPILFRKARLTELISSVLVFDIFAMDGHWPKDLNEVLILIELASADACKWEQHKQPL